jgi:hypothetical protein
MKGIHVFAADKTWMAGTIGERSDAVLRTAMPGHDGPVHLEKALARHTGE